MILGKKPFYILLTLLFILSMVNGVPFLLSLMRPHNGLNSDQFPKDERYMPPYDAKNLIHQREDGEHTVTVFGPSFTWDIQSSHSGTRGEDAKPESIQVLKPPQKASLDGNRPISLRGIQFLQHQQAWDSTGSAIEKTDKHDYYVMESDVQKSIENEVSPIVSRWGISPDYGPHELRLLFDTNISPEEICFSGLFNVETGGRLAGSYKNDYIVYPTTGRSFHGYQLWGSVPSGSGNQVDENFEHGLLTWTDRFLLTGDTKLAFHMAIYSEEKTTVTLKPGEMKSLIINGEEYRFYLVEGISKEPLKDNDLNVLEQLTGKTNLVILPKPRNVSSLVMYGNDGEKLSSMGSQHGSGPGYEAGYFASTYKYPLEKMDHALITFNKEVQYLVWDLSDFEFIQSDNSEVAFLEKRIPDLYIEDRFELIRAYSNLFEGHVSDELKLASNVTYPVPLKDAKVSDLLSIIDSPGLDLEYALTPDGISVRQAGTTASYYKPAIWRIYSTLDNFWLYIYGFLIFVVAYKLFLLVQSFSLQKNMKTGGYSFNIWQVEYLYARLGKKAWSLPPYDHIASIPSVNPDRLEDLVRVTKEYDINRLGKSQ